ncbi:MAG TPA: MFS transporter [Terriglobales bacterium]|nr:MFS transporter [Terriglobales bacterium]
MSFATPNITFPKSSVKGTVFVHLDFVLTGVVMTLLGPMLPMLSRRWALNDTQAGYLFIGQWATSILGMLLSGVFVERYGSRITLIVGLMLMAFGMAGLGYGGWVLGFISVCIFGAGTGVTTPTANLLIAKSNPLKSAAALNLLNSSWGVGAMACPFIVAAAQRSQRASYFLYGMAAALALLAISLLSIRFTVDGDRSLVKRLPHADVSVWKNRLVPAIAVLFFTYVGIETSIGGWVALYARRIDPSASTLWAITPSFFWGALLIGRALAPLALTRLRDINLATFGVGLAAAGIIVLLAAKTITVIMVGASIAGLGLASVFPINVSLLSHWFGEAATPVSGTIFSIGNLGGAVIPWMVGFISTHFSLRFGFVTPLIGAVGMLAFYLTSEKRQREATPAGNYC